MTDPRSLREEFMADHTRLEEALRELGDAAEGALAPELIRVWREFEALLRAHLEVEEEAMIPLVEDNLLREQLLAEHTEIRAHLDELGLAVELHTVREEMIDAFVKRLHEHAAHEASHLYRAMESRIDAASQRSLRDRIDTAG